MKRLLQRLFLKPYYTKSWNGTWEQEPTVFTAILGIIIALSLFALLIWYAIENPAPKWLFDDPDPPAAWGE